MTDPKQIATTTGRDVWLSAGRLFQRCAKCGKIVRVNKPIFGSLHVCALDEDDD